MTMATNERIVDHVDQLVKATDAGRVRVFEVSLPGVKGGADPKIQRQVDKLSTNFGHVGQQYAAFLVANKPMVEKLVHQLQDKVVKDLNSTPEERFWVSFVTCELAAAVLCKKAGILSVDINKLQQWLYQEFVSQRMGVKRNYLPPTEAAVGAVLQYADYYRDQLVVTEFAGGKQGYGAQLVQPKGSEVLILLAKKDMKLRFKEAHFKHWVHTTLKHSPSVLVNELVKLGIATIKKAAVSAGIANTTNARFTCIEIDLSNSMFSTLIES